jgi:hypothetical protein
MLASDTGGAAAEGEAGTVGGYRCRREDGRAPSPQGTILSLLIKNVPLLSLPPPPSTQPHPTPHPHPQPHAHPLFISPHYQSLEDLRSEIRSSTSSMTSVPLPLKFLQPRYESFCTAFKTSQNPKAKVRPTFRPTLHTAKRTDSHTRSLPQLLLADTLSVMSITMGRPGARDSLTFRLAGSNEDIGSWVRVLTIGKSGRERQREKKERAPKE